KTLYGYDPAGGGDAKREFSRASNSNKYFFRTDFNLAKGQQATVRYNRVYGLVDIGTPSSGTFRTPDAYYRTNSYTDSTVGQLNSAWGSNVNELRVAYTHVDDKRGGQPFEQKPFPQVTVVLQGSTTIVAGREQFS